MDVKTLLAKNMVARSIIRVYSHFDRVPAVIALEDYRFYFTANVAFIQGWIIHLVWFFVFMGLGQPLMMRVQLASMACYVVTIVLSRRGKLNVALVMGMSEVLAHQAIAVVILGWAAGFQYVIAAITLFPFLKQNISWLFRTSLVLLCVATFLYLEINYKNAQPMVVLAPVYVVGFSYANIVMSFLFTGVWGFTLSHAIERTEAIVLNKNKELFAAEKAAEQAEMQRQLEVKELDNEIYRLKNVELKNSHDEIQRRNEIIESERKKSEALLLNILPEETAIELMQTGKALSRKYEMVTVMFTDFVGFTKVAEKMQPEELVQQIDAYFQKFDDITHQFGVEKIKTIGDAYMCAGGLSVTNKTSPADVVRAALAIQKSAQEMLSGQFAMRIGIHTGSVVAGVVGKHKFQYDIWGDTVNIAARMEQSALPGTINISSATYELIKDAFVCAHRGKVEAKNKGAMDMYIVSEESDA